ncbi:toxin RelE [soil metagenome]|nr:type II toxin-antitoxin system RelE/ParE family toxin [Gemmatimonadota bacterium]
MIFVEFTSFSHRRSENLDDEAYRALQNALLEHPDAGVRIPGTGGLRKIRWAAEGRGKRGGVRGIYSPVESRGVMLMLLIYPKNEQDDLTPAQKRLLAGLVRAELAQAGEP